MTELADLGFAERDGLWVDGPEEIGAVETAVGVFVGWIDVTWPHPHEPVPWLRDVVHVVRADDLSRIVEHARELRGEMLQVCRFCGQHNVPGHMHSDDVCQSCAERHLGVVH
jgi:hypothetical protein